MNTESRKKFIINFFYFLILFGLSILAVRYALPALFPFVIALVVTIALKPLVKFASSKLHIDRKSASVVFVLLFYGTIGLVVILLTIQLIQWVVLQVGKLPYFFESSVAPVLDSFAEWLDGVIEGFGENSVINVNVEDVTAKLISALTDTITNFSVNVIPKITNYATSAPAFMLNVVITVISSVFLLSDFDLIKEFIMNQFSEKKRKTITAVSEHLVHLIGKYLVSYLLIMLITFGEIFIGLICIGQKNAVGISAAIAAFDILPVVGSGLILLPWAVVCIFSGMLGKAIGILVLWAILSIIRQIIEPKIIGSTVGMHPLLTLFAMLLGNFIYGGFGILLLPIAIALCLSLQRQGIIHIYNPLPESAIDKETGKISGTIDKLLSKIIQYIKKSFKKIISFFKSKTNSNKANNKHIKKNNKKGRQ